MAETSATPITGPAGEAVRLELDPDVPPANASQIVDRWLITARAYHPLWWQYLLGCVRLDELPGLRPPVLHFPGATHELLLVALDPDHGPWTPGKLRDPTTVRELRPLNVVHQFTASDDEMRQVLSLAAQAVVHGVLNPETGDAPELIRTQWLSAVTKTLAHIRGEAHAP